MLKHLKEKIILLFGICFVLFTSGCANGFDFPFDDSTKTKTMYKASSSYSDYTDKLIKKLNLQNTNGDVIPDVFFVEGSQILNLTNDQIYLLTKTCHAGKTIVIGKPTAENILAFGLAVETALALNEELKTETSVSDNSPYEFIQEITGSIYKNINSPINGIDDFQKKYIFEAIGIRQEQIYYIHDIDETLRIETSSEDGAPIVNESGNDTIEKKEEYSAPTVDNNHLINSSIENFSAWVLKTNDKNANNKYITEDGYRYLMKSADNDMKPEIKDKLNAQSNYHEFTATFHYGDHPHYDGRYDGKKERVELFIDVWAVCDIANQKDYYLVRNSICCHNNELGCDTGWSNKYCGPYFNNLDISTTINGSKQALLTNSCSPQNSSGSTSYSTGSSFNIGGNVGFNSSGPTGGISAGYSVSESTTRSIPNIGVNFSTSNNKPSWTFQGDIPKAEWSGLHTTHSTIHDILQNLACYDTYSLFTLPSDYSYSGDNVNINTSFSVKLSCLTGWTSGFLSSTLNYSTLSLTSHYYNDFFVQKPCNACEDYTTYFIKDKNNNSIVDIATLYKVLSDLTIINDKKIDWNKNVSYYAVGKNNLDKVAKNHFDKMEDLILKNKNLLKSSGFKGKYTFAIKRSSVADTLPPLDAFEIDFGE